MSAAPFFDPIEHLARADKWFLGGGDDTIFAPPFPLWLDSPGFWDEATVGECAVAPLFTVSAVDGEGREIAMRVVSRRWTPAELTVEYRLENGVTATEVRTLQRGVFGSEWRFRALRPLHLHLVAWTAQPASEVDLSGVAWNGALSFSRTLPNDGYPLRVEAQLACAGEADSWAAYVAEAGALRPSWKLAPFEDRWRAEALPCEIRVDAASSSASVLYAALHRRVFVSGDSGGATFALRLTTPDVAQSPPTRPPSSAATLGGSSRRRWQEHFALAPMFRCSDPYFETYYWYRWYAIGLLSSERSDGGQSSTSICEGVGALHRPNAAAAASAARELRWLADPALARGVIRSCIIRADSAEHALTTAGAAVASWGDAILAVDASLPDDAFLAEIYPSLGALARAIATTGDAESSGLLDHPNETLSSGAERARLKGVGATADYYDLLRALAVIAERVGESADANAWRTLASKTSHAVQQRMWSDARQLFLDVASEGSESPPANVSAESLYPYLSDLANADQIPALARALVDPECFGTPYPVASLAVATLTASAADAEGAEDIVHRAARVRPAINARIVQALGRCAAYDSSLRTLTAELLRRFVHMLFNDGDLRQPNCFDEYDPLTGRASFGRGTDDHLASSVNDLLLQFVAGIRPHARGVTIDPFPFGLDLVEVSGVRVRGHSIDVSVSKDRWIATVDGVRHEQRLGMAIEIPDQAAA